MIVIRKAESGPPEWVKRKGRRGPSPKYPFRGLEVGGTFVVPPEMVSMQLAVFRRFVSNQSARLGRRFLCQQMADGSVEVYRER